MKLAKFIDNLWSQFADRVSSREVRQPGKAPNHSVNWSLGCAKVEVVDAMKGKQEGGRPSRQG